jgi:ribosomal-protein-alanine N-acetyltransferase
MTWNLIDGLLDLETMINRTEASAALRITELTASDLPDVVAIEQHSNLEPWNRDSFLEELFRPHSFLLVARVLAGYGEIVAGFICFWLVADEIQILNLAVHEAHRRQGIGRALMIHCLNFGLEKRACRAALEVRSGNVAAQQLYRSLGFQVLGERPDYYGGLRESAVLMELSMAIQRAVGWREANRSLFTQS